MTLATFHITPEWLRANDACWLGSEIDQYFLDAGTTHVTPRQVAEDQTLTIEDRLWVLCCVLDEIPSRSYSFVAAHTGRCGYEPEDWDVGDAYVTVLEIGLDASRWDTNSFRQYDAQRKHWTTITLPDLLRRIEAPEMPSDSPRLWR